MSVLSQGCSSMPVMKQYLLMTSVEMLAPSVRRTITRNTVPLAIEALDAQADAPAFFLRAEYITYMASKPVLHVILQLRPARNAYRERIAVVLTVVAFDVL